MTTRWPEARAPRGMVATPHLLATQSGLAALRAGGNALDAADRGGGHHRGGLPAHERPGRRQRVADLRRAPASGCARSAAWAAPAARRPPSTGTRRAGSRAPSRARRPRAPLTVPGGGGRLVAGAPSTVAARWAPPLGWKALLADAIPVRARGLPGLRRPAHPAAPRARSLHRARARRDSRALSGRSTTRTPLRRGPAGAAPSGPHPRGGARRRAPRRFYQGRRPSLVAAAAAAGSPLAVEDLAEHRSRLDGAAPHRVRARARSRASRRPPRASRPSRCWA